MPELLARLVMHDGRPPARIGRAAHPDSTDPQEHIVTFEYRDEDLDPLTVRPCHGGRPTIHFQTGPHGTYVPVNHVEELVAGIRDAARQAAGQQKPPVGYGDGKGRVYCLRCANAVAAEVPLTVDIVDHWELCPSCGRHVVDVANNQAAGQTPTTEHLCVCDDSPEECAAVGEPDACPTPETHNWGCGCPTDELPAAKAREALAGYMGGRNNDPALASLLNDYHLAVAEAARAGATAPVVGQPAEAQPADRAAILREAADIAEQVAMRLQDHGDPTQSIGAYEVMSDLRRMADEETH